MTSSEEDTLTATNDDIEAELLLEEDCSIKKNDDPFFDWVIIKDHQNNKIKIRREDKTKDEGSNIDTETKATELTDYEENIGKDENIKDNKVDFLNISSLTPGQSASLIFSLLPVMPAKSCSGHTLTMLFG